MATIKIINGTGSGWIEVRGTFPAVGIGLFREKGSGTWQCVHTQSGQRFGGFGFPTKERALEYISLIVPLTNWAAPVADIPRDVFLEAARLRTKLMDSNYESMKPSNETLDT